MAGDREIRAHGVSMLTRKAPLAAALVAVLVAARLWGGGPLRQDAEAGLTRVRWGNVSIALPAENPRLLAAPMVDEEGRLVLRVEPVDVSGQAIFIDGTNGTVLYDTIIGSNREAADAVLSTLTVGPVELVAPWPYSGDGAGIPRESLGPGISFIPPDPASGIVVQWIEEEAGPESLRFWNGRSKMVLSLAGIADVARTNVAVEDREAFERLRLSIQVTPDGP